MALDFPVFFKGILLISGTIICIAQAKRHPPPGRSCPKVVGCHCDFHTNALSCFNVSTVPDIPRWVNSVTLHGGKSKTLTLTKNGQLPNHVLTFGVNTYMQVDINGDFFQRGSSITTFVLTTIGRTTLSGDLFKNVRKVHKLIIENTNLCDLRDGILEGLKPNVLIWKRMSNKIPANQMVKAVCSMDLSHLSYADFTATGFRRIPTKMAECLQSLVPLKIFLNQNDFSDITSLRSLGKVKNLKGLFMAGCNITGAATLGFIRGMHLKDIDISNNHLPTTGVKKIICDLDPRSIETIAASGNQIGYIGDDFFSCLNKSKVKQLILRRGNITGVSKLALGNFLGALNLDLADNLIPIEDLSFVAAAKHVKSLHLSHNRLTKFPDFKVNNSCLNIKHLIELHLVGNIISTVQEEDTRCLFRLQVLTLKRNKIVVLPRGAFRNMTSLRQLSLGANKLERLGENSLPKQLKALDLVENDLHYFGLSPIADLNELYKFGTTGADNINWRGLFINKTKLQSLHIGSGRITRNHLKDILRNLTSLVSLRLEKMGIREIPLEILRLKHLKSLTLVSNKIEVIPEYFIPILDGLKTVDIAYNPFACNCSLMPFSNWLRNASRLASVTALDDSLCFSPSPYKNTPLFNFEKDCRNLLPIILPSVLVPLLLLIIVVTAVSVHYRGYIRYACMLVKARWRGYDKLHEGRSFKYDTFVSYNKDDAAWVLRVLRPKLEDDAGYQICLHDRDFTVGEDIVDNIITSIDESRKTILVLSDNFAKSQWCQLEMSLAQHKLFEDNRDVLILIRLGEVAEENMTRTMRMLMRTKTYITWPQGKEGIDLFWRNLIFALRRPPGVLMEDPEWPIGGANNRQAENV